MDARVAGDGLGWDALIVLNGAVVDDPKARIDLGRIWIGSVGRDQTEPASGVGRKGLAGGVAGLVIMHLENLGAVSSRRQNIRAAPGDVRRHSQLPV